MPDFLKQHGLRIITGHGRSPMAAAARFAAACIEPFYSTAMLLRNTCYDLGIFKAHDLGRPTISVGNITTGGTGKTPVVKWLADEMRRRGRRPAILLRGYGSSTTDPSDEAQLLDQSLNSDQPVKIPVQANPSRIRAAADVLRDHPDVTHFILDDGFQHRRAKRDFNLVLISATEPFGYGHVLPRGLLREPLAGLARADAFLITRCSLVSMKSLREITQFLTQHCPSIPIFRCTHEQSELWIPSTSETKLVALLAGEKVFLSAGIGDPAAFEKQIASLRCSVVGTRWFADHHAYTAIEIQSIHDAAKRAGAAIVLTTEKDWVKIQRHPLPETEPLIGVMKLGISFWRGDAERLLSHLSITEAPDVHPGLHGGTGAS